MTSNGPDEPAFPSGPNADGSTPTPEQDHPADLDGGPEAAAFARLRAADPAAGEPAPDLAALRARVDAAISADAARPDAEAPVTPASGSTDAGTAARPGTAGGTAGGTSEPGAGERAAAAGDASPRRRTGRLLLAAAASVALLAAVAVGGVAVGRASAPAPATLTAGYAIPTIGGPGGAAAAGEAAASVATGSGVGAPARRGFLPPEAAPAAGAAADAKVAMPYFGRVILRGGTLPDDAGTATGYRFDAAGVDRQALAARLAAAFGIPGEPVSDGSGAWTVGLTDGTSATVTVGPDALASWYVSVPERAPYYCPATPGVPEAGAEDGVTAAPVPPAPCTSPTGAALPEAEAVAQAQRALAAAGLPTDGLQWTTRSDAGVTEAAGAITADGRRTGMAMSFAYGPGGGLFSANGMAASLVAVPGYPVVGARTAVDRTADPRWGSLGPSPIYPEGGPVPLAAVAKDGAAVGVASAAGGTAAGGSADAAASSAGPGDSPAAGGTVAAEGTVTADGSATAEPGTGVAATTAPASPPPAPTKDGRPVLQTQVTELTATSAVLDLAQFWQPDGSVLLLPAYAVTADDGSLWSVVALDPAYVDFVSGR